MACSKMILIIENYSNPHFRAFSKEKLKFVKEIKHFAKMFITIGIAGEMPIFQFPKEFCNLADLLQTNIKGKLPRRMPPKSNKSFSF